MVDIHDLMEHEGDGGKSATERRDINLGHQDREFEKP
jgi:hypothetical protein